jgi:hypothetical protein
MQLGIYRTERMRKVNAWSDRPQVFHTHLPLSHIPKVRTYTPCITERGSNSVISFTLMCSIRVL